MEVLGGIATPAVVYLVIAALVALDSLLPAVPSEVLVVAAGVLSASGDLVAGWAVAAAIAGALVGDHLVYRIGRHGLSGVLARNRLGQRIARSVERVHDRFRAVSGAAIVAARFIPLGRTIGAGTAGLAGVPPARFTIFSVVGVVLWVAWLTGLGFVTGAQTGWPAWASVATGMGVAIVVGLCVAVPEARIRRSNPARPRARNVRTAQDTRSLPATPACGLATSSGQGPRCAEPIGRTPPAR